jgi:transcriptional regulator with XRE-family HTH domain
VNINSGYTPEVFVEDLMRRLGTKTRSSLARAVGVSPSVVSKIWHRRLAISSEILLQVHEATGIPIRELRRMMGDQRPFFRRFSVGAPLN